MNTTIRNLANQGNLGVAELKKELYSRIQDCIDGLRGLEGCTNVRQELVQELKDEVKLCRKKLRKL